MRQTVGQSAVLDAGDGAGWDLAESLLRPKVVAGAALPMGASKTRAGAGDALSHRFFKVEPVKVAKGAFNPMRGIAATLGGLERAISRQAREVSDTSLQLRTMLTDGTDVRTVRDKAAELQQKEKGLTGLFGLFQSSAAQLQEFVARDFKRAARDGQRGLTALGQAAQSVRSDAARALAELAEELTQEGAAEDTVPTPRAKASASASASLSAAAGPVPKGGTVISKVSPQKPAAAQQKQEEKRPRADSGVGARAYAPSGSGAVGSGESRLTSDGIEAALETAAAAAAEAAAVAAAQVAAVAAADAGRAGSDGASVVPTAGASAGGSGGASSTATAGPASSSSSSSSSLPPAPTTTGAPGLSGLSPASAKFLDEDEQRRVKERMAQLQEQMSKAAERLAAMEAAMARQREMMKELESLMGPADGAPAAGATGGAAKQPQQQPPKQRLPPQGGVLSSGSNGGNGNGGGGSTRAR